MENFDFGALAYQAIFYLFATIIVVSATMVDFARSIIYSAFSLLFTLFGISAMYVYLNADFLAVTQIVVYVGGILILLLFGVMLTNKITQERLLTDVFNLIPSLIIMLAIMGTLLYTFLYHAKWQPGEPRTSTVVEPIGYELITNYLLPFEIVSILLFVAMIGAAYISRSERKVSASK